MISLEFSVVSGKYLIEILESIEKQIFQDYEVVIVNSNPDCSHIIKNFGAKEIFCKTGKLEARRLAHENSRGDYELLLEETRLLRTDALQKLNMLKEVEMAIIDEEEIGTNFVNKLNRMDADIAFRNGGANPSSLYLLPRYYRRDVLDYSLTKAYANLQPEIIPYIVASDLEIIYTEAYGKFRKIGKSEGKLIKKYGEKTITESFLKYYRYGKTQRFLSNTYYGRSYSFKTRKRAMPSIKFLPVIAIIYALRGSAFFLGYYIG